MAELEALLFDVDGTLADTERDGHRVAFNQAFSDFELDWDWDDALYGELLSVTGGKERIRFYIDTYEPRWPDSQSINEFAAELHRAKTEYYLQLLSKGLIPLRPGVERLLREAVSDGITLGIATTTSPENVTVLLENTLGAESVEWFSVIAAGDMVVHKKPAPDVFLLAMEQLSLNPENCLAFEDSTNGLRSSLSAGVDTIVTVNEYTKNDSFAGATLVVDSLGEPGSPLSTLAGEFSADYIDLDCIRRIASSRRTH